MAYSRYGSKGKGLTDRGTRSYARKLAQKHGSGSTQVRDYTTFTNKAGLRIAKGSFQSVGLTSYSMGFGFGTSFLQALGGMPAGERKSLLDQLNMPESRQSAAQAGVQKMLMANQAKGGFAPQGIRTGYGNGSTPDSVPGSSGVSNWDYWRHLWGGEKPLGLPPEKKKQVATVAMLGSLSYIALRVLS